MKDSFTAWLDRFTTWIRNEPVRAAEAVRAVLFAVTAMFAFTDQETVAAIAGGITALFSIYSSQNVRNKVEPLAKQEKGPQV